MIKSALTLFCLFILFTITAQEGIVSGTLNDETGEPLPGVNITIKGSTSGTISDLNGHYKITCKVGDILVFNFIGYSATEKIVTREMFTESIEEKDKVHFVPVENIKSSAFDKLINQKDNTNKIIHIDTSKLKWDTDFYVYYNRLQNIDLKNIKYKNNLVKLEKAQPPLNYEIKTGTYTAITQVINLPKLQKKFAQGRPNNNTNTWFGADFNEIFAWGPEIKTLAFDGSDYPFDKNGRLTPVNQSNQLPAKAYNPQDLFCNGLVLKNSVNLKVKNAKSKYFFNYLNRQESGVLSPIHKKANSINFKFTRDSKKHQWTAKMNFINSNNDFDNKNALWTKTNMAILQTPPTFDNAQGDLLNDNSQRSSSPLFKNNPYYIINSSISKQKSNSFNGSIFYGYEFEKFDLSLKANYSKEIQSESFYAPSNLTGFNSSFNSNNNIDASNISFQFHSAYNQYNDLILKTTAIINNENLDFKRNLFDLDDLDVQKNRISFNWLQSFGYNKLLSGNLHFNLKNNIYLLAKHQNWLLPSIGIAYDFEDLLNFDILANLRLSANYSKSIAEQPLYMSNKSHNTLSYDLETFNNLVENNELFYDENLKLESRQSYYFQLQTGGDLFYGDMYFNLNINYNLNQSKNSIFPILQEDAFELKNIADIQSHIFETTISFRSYFGYDFHWNGSIIFTKEKSKVQKLNNSNKVVPITGFSSVSKNLIEGQPVGVIIGSVYQRNEQGQLIISSDGFPLVSDETKIIGDPTPDFYMAFENTFTFRNFSLNILADFQKGGDIWNGTKNTLSYLGLSKSTEKERLISGYVFDGVSENGLPNILPVDFANPVNGLNGNRWYRYGTGGVAEDAIEDGTWFRIKELSLTYTAKFRFSDFFKNLSIKLYVNNLLILSKYSGASPMSWFNNYEFGQGLDYFNLPDTREFGIGINLTI